MTNPSLRELRDPSAPPDPRPSRKALDEAGFGRRFGPYVTLRRVGGGRSAEVFLARDPALGRKVALKALRPELAGYERFRRLFAGEARLGAQLDHPNIVRVIDYDDQGPSPFLVLEWIAGQPLHRLIDRYRARAERWPFAPAVHVVAAVARALHHAHTQSDVQGRALGIVHRDVSPQNVLVGYDGSVKLIDFGVARGFGQHEAQGLLGRFRYLAPETARGEVPDARTDIFGAGIILFELLTGVPLYAPRTDAEALALAEDARIPPIESLRADVPEALRAIVERALARAPEDRFPTARALADALTAWLRQNASEPASELEGAVRALFTADQRSERELDLAADRRLFGLEVVGDVALPPSERDPTLELYGSTLTLFRPAPAAVPAEDPLAGFVPALKPHRLSILAYLVLLLGAGLLGVALMGLRA